MLNRRRPHISALLSTGTVALLASVTLAGCGGDPQSSDNCYSEIPVRTGWETVFDGGIYMSTGTSADVTSISIGGTQQAGNFINRGDIEVYQTLPPSSGGGGRIVIQMRKFTFDCSQEAAEGDAENPGSFSKIQPWIFASTSYRPPDDPSLADAGCVNPETGAQEFYNGCNVRVYYDGQNQPIRDGADIRVFLPSDYSGGLNLTTEDNIQDSTYQDRSDVTVYDARGRVTVKADSGITKVKIADDALPAPSCSADANQACFDFLDDNDEPAPWSPNCPCSAENLNSINVASEGTESMSITIDTPPDYWAVGNLTNQDPANTIAAGGTYCDANIECDGFSSCELDPIDCNDAEKPWRCKGVTNFPSGALDGTGVSIIANSDACRAVARHTGPELYGAEPTLIDQGDITLCSGCLEGQIDVPAAP